MPYSRWVRDINKLGVAVIVTGLLALAFTFRAWEAGWSLPYLFHNDEGNEILRAMQLGAGMFDFDRVSKGLYFYVLFFEFGIYFGVLAVLGVVSSPSDFAEIFVRDPSAFYLISRLTTAVIGTATVFFVYRLGRAAYSSWVGIVAAAFITINVLHVSLSHFATVDVPMACLAVVALLFVIRLASSGGLRNYLAAGVFTALATATKLPGVVLLIPLGVGHCLYAWSHGDSRRDLFLGRRLWAAVAVFVVVYVAAAPGILWQFDDVVFGTARLFVSGGEGDAVELLDERALIENTNLFLFYADAIVQSMSWPIFFGCLLGLFNAAWRRTKADVIFLSFVVPFYLAMALSRDAHLFFPRYILPVIPVLTILGGRALVDILSQLKDPRRVVLAGVTALIALSVAPVYLIVQNNVELGLKDTRAVAKEWFDANVVSGATVFIEGTRARPYESTVPLKNSDENLSRRIEESRNSEPGVAMYFELELKVRSGPTYDLVTVPLEGLQSVIDYKRAGVEYFVLRPMEYPNSRLQFDWPEFVAAVRSDSDIALVERFEPVAGETTGPTVEVYHVEARN